MKYNYTCIFLYLSNKRPLGSISSLYNLCFVESTKPIKSGEIYQKTTTAYFSARENH